MAADDDAVLGTTRMVMPTDERGEGVGELRRESLDVGGVSNATVVSRVNVISRRCLRSAAACMRQTSRTMALADDDEVFGGEAVATWAF